MDWLVQYHSIKIIYFIIWTQVFSNLCSQEYESRKKKSHKKKVFYNPDEYGPEDIFCRKCFKPFISLRGLWSHVTQLKPCRKFYGEDAILEMRESLSALPPVSPNTQVIFNHSLEWPKANANCIHLDCSMQKFVCAEWGSHRAKDPPFTTELHDFQKFII